jgi:hypothetical protein
MFRALIAARLAHLGTDAAQATGKLGTPRHLTHRKRAVIRATPCQFDAARHARDGRLAETFGRAMFSGDRGIVARGDAGAELRVGQRISRFEGWLQMHVERNRVADKRNEKRGNRVQDFQPNGNRFRRA